MCDDYKSINVDKCTKATQEEADTFEQANGEYRKEQLRCLQTNYYEFPRKDVIYCKWTEYEQAFFWFCVSELDSDHTVQVYYDRKWNEYIIKQDGYTRADIEEKFQYLPIWNFILDYITRPRKFVPFSLLDGNEQFTFHRFLDAGYKPIYYTEKNHELVEVVPTNRENHILHSNYCWWIKEFDLIPERK